MIQEIKTYKTADLVLQLSRNYDPHKLRLGAWDRYLDLLCENRQYQKEAIQNAIGFLASGLYADIDSLVAENWDNIKNIEIRNRYPKKEDYIRQLQLPGKLAAAIDLATGTGKSYVIYGIAQIMLALGLVDKVLVLCPSLTIEDGLLEKFMSLASDSALLKAIPEGSRYKNPAIKGANVTIKPGDICIENIHAVYDKTGSSIKDSFWGIGDRTLVLNDEAHHIFNSIDGRDEKSKSIKKWKEFLLSPDYNFKYILGFTGTAYIGNEYFNDVIYRYSLRQAVNDVVVKMVDYVSKNDDADTEIKFQEIYDNHIQNRDWYRKVKPLTILITKDISSAKKRALELKEFFIKKAIYDENTVDKKILIVTSHSDHKANVGILKEVDRKDNPVEWIVSVSMLTEGWDVKNVFQIVPWEDRAFNSKLLIAQVLGRGLRIPMEYQNPQPKVRIFNHDAWSRNIRALVDEILEIEMKLVSFPLPKGTRSSYHFEVYHIDYSKTPEQKISKKKHMEFDYKKGFIEIESQPDDNSTDKTAEYTDLRGEVRLKNTLIQHNSFSVDQVIDNIIHAFEVRAWEGKILKLPHGNYTKDKMPSREDLKKIIQESMCRAGIKGHLLIEKNKIRIENSFSTLLRKTGKTTAYKRIANKPKAVSTLAIQSESLSIGHLRHNATVFYSSDFNNELDEENIQILNAINEHFDQNPCKEVNNHIFKTPFSMVFSKSGPERRFIERLCLPENAQYIESWMKSRDTGFYQIEYSITSLGGKHSKSPKFNPDFFIKTSKDDMVHIIVIEIKEDKDDSDENKAKNKYAKQHFINLNKELEELSIKQQYHFHFLSPNSYDAFFDGMKNGTVIGDAFNSELGLMLNPKDETTDESSNK
jgi:type III restriction enzyme